MNPTIGRIVHYNSNLGPAAAIVINVRSDELIDLHVLRPDGDTRHITLVEQGTTCRASKAKTHIPG